MSLRIAIDPASATAPFEQLRARIADQARSGALPVGYKLPTVRGLAEELGLAANTVAKAYRALEADGVIETRGRNGTFIARRQAADGATDDAARTFVLEARRQGLSRDEAVRLLEGHWG